MVLKVSLFLFKEIIGTSDSDRLCRGHLKEVLGFLATFRANHRGLSGLAASSRSGIRSLISFCPGGASGCTSILPAHGFFTFPIGCCRIVVCSCLIISSVLAFMVRHVMIITGVSFISCCARRNVLTASESGACCTLTVVLLVEITVILIVFATLTLAICLLSLPIFVRCEHRIYWGFMNSCLERLLFLQLVV